MTNRSESQQKLKDLNFRRGNRAFKKFRERLNIPKGKGSSNKERGVDKGSEDAVQNVKTLKHQKKMLKHQKKMRAVLIKGVTKCEEMYCEKRTRLKNFNIVLNIKFLYIIINAKKKTCLRFT